MAEVEEAAALALLVRETDSNVIAFGLYRRIAERTAAAEAVKEQLALPVFEFALSAESKNALEMLASVPGTSRACLFFYDIEEALPEAAGYVNLQREAFAEVPHACVFWVREHRFRELAERAPDFWSWRSGVFDFRGERAQMPAPARRALLGEPLFRDRADLERRIKLYRQLVDEQSAREKPDLAFVAGLELKLVDLLRATGDFGEAEGYARSTLEWGRRASSPALEGAALRVLGNLAIDHGQVARAEELYRQSLQVAERSKNQEALAAAYHNLGWIAEERAQFDEAEQWYGKALGFYERLGLEAGSHRSGSGSRKPSVGTARRRGSTSDLAGSGTRRTSTMS